MYQILGFHIKSYVLSCLNFHLYCNFFMFMSWIYDTGKILIVHLLVLISSLLELRNFAILFVLVMTIHFLIIKKKI